MNLTRNFLYAIVALLTLALGAFEALSADTPAVKLTEPQPRVGKLYADTGISLGTPDFKDGEYGYFAGVGYQINKHFALDARASHHGLDASGSAIQDLGARAVARLPWRFLSPYGFLGASFDLERDAWHLEPGLGVELGVTNRLQGLSVFAEAGIDTRLENGSLRDSGWKFASGLRLRF